MSCTSKQYFYLSADGFLKFDCLLFLWRKNKNKFYACFYEIANFSENPFRIQEACSGFQVSAACDPKKCSESRLGGGHLISKSDGSKMPPAGLLSSHCATMRYGQEERL
jgi:hypothetical protein